MHLNLFPTPMLQLLPAFHRCGVCRSYLDSELESEQHPGPAVVRGVFGLSGWRDNGLSQSRVRQ